MSYSYDARFDTTSLKLSPLIDKLESALQRAELEFTGTMMRLFLDKGSHRPTPELSNETLFPKAVEGGLAPLKELAKDWAGFSLMCDSLPLQRRFGRGSTSEVYVRVFRAPNKEWTLMYSEGDTVQAERCDDPDLARELYALQTTLCAELGFKFSIYEEEEDDYAIPTLKELAQRLGRGRQENLGTAVVAATSLVSFDEAKKLAPSSANQLQLSTLGFVVFPFLAEK
jgi:hypothetical protein